jgi:hypothetical protein
MIRTILFLTQPTITKKDSVFTKDDSKDNDGKPSSHDRGERWRSDNDSNNYTEARY